MDSEQQIKTLRLSLYDYREKLKQPPAHGMSELQMLLEKINGLLHQVDFRRLAGVPHQTIKLLAAPIQNSAVAITEYVAGVIEPEAAAKATTQPPQNRVRSPKNTEHWLHHLERQ